jgi:hypothetical protein
MTSTVYQPTPTRTTGVATLAPEPACIVVVTPSGRLRLPTAPAQADASVLPRRTRTGTTYRIELPGGIACWLDGDHYAGELNWPATQMCQQLSHGSFTGPDDAPFVCGPVLFTGTGRDGVLIALSERQVRRVVEAYAAVDEPDD